MNDLLTEFFSDIVDTNFTAQMEADLDEVASGDRPWVEVVEAFYKPFSIQLSHANEAMPEVKTEPEKIGRECPNCGHDLVVRDQALQLVSESGHGVHKLSALGQEFWR